MAEIHRAVAAVWPWRAVLDVSTGYLTPETQQALDGWTSNDAPMTFATTTYGWFIYCPEEWDDEAYAEVPADLREVLTWARARGAEYVLFDADGYDEHEGLEWRDEQQAVVHVVVPDPPDFDPTKVTITRHRQSVTQQEVTVAYDGRVLWDHAGDTMRLCDDGEYRGHDDAYWIEAAHTKLAIEGLTGRRLPA
jgi:hypothetical protein